MQEFHVDMIFPLWVEYYTSGVPCSDSHGASHSCKDGVEMYVLYIRVRHVSDCLRFRHQQFPWLRNQHRKIFEARLPCCCSDSSLFLLLINTVHFVIEQIIVLKQRHAWKNLKPRLIYPLDGIQKQKSGGFVSLKSGITEHWTETKNDEGQSTVWKLNMVKGNTGNRD